MSTMSNDTSVYLVEIIQPTFNKNKHFVIRSQAIVQESKGQKIDKDKASLI